MTRPLEAREFATEAIRLLDEADLKGFELIRATTLVNLGGVDTALGRFDTAREPLESALELLRPLPPAPGVVYLRAVALLNLTRARLADNEIEAAVEGAQVALELLEELKSGPAILNRGVARLNLGIALVAAGREHAAVEHLEAAVAELSPHARDLDVVPIAEALNAAGQDLWESFLAQVHDEAQFVQALSVLRQRPPEDMDRSVEDVRRALADATADPARLRMIRQLTRGRRHRDAAFEPAWQAAGHPVPDWMTVSPDLELSALAWWNPATWQQSLEYLAGHPDLLDPATDIILEELRSLEQEPGQVDQHLRLRADAAVHGPERAYARIISELLLDDWFESGLGPDFLTRHDTALLGPDVAEDVARRVAEGDTDAELAQAVLLLAGRGEERVAYRVYDEPSFGTTLLEPAWRSVDFDRLAAIARLCRQGVSLGSSYARLANVALAIAEAARGRRDEALALVREALEAAPGEAERAPLSAAAADALAHHPEHEEVLAELLRELTLDPRAGSAQR
jgi:tetratricopeptide (TPR) repeat protein